MLWYTLLIVHSGQPAVPACGRAQGLSLIKIMAGNDNGMWHPAPASSYEEASRLCSRYGGTLPVVTNKNRQCIVDSASFGSKMRVPVSAQSEEYKNTYSQTHPDKCSFLYNNQKIYPGDCGTSAHMSAQSDYIVCEVPREFIATSITARDIPVLPSCHGEYDMCGTCDGPNRSCLECQDGCLSGPPPDASGSQSSGGWQGSASFVVPVVVLCIVVVVLIAVVVVKKKRSRGRETVEPPPSDIVSFENPRYNSQNSTGQEGGDEESIEYDQIDANTAIAQSGDGYLLPRALQDGGCALYYQATEGQPDVVYHNDSTYDTAASVVLGSSDEDEDEQNKSEPYYSTPLKKVSEEEGGESDNRDYDLAFEDGDGPGDNSQDEQ